MKELEFYPLEEERDFEKYHDLFKDSFPETLGTKTSEKEHYKWKFKNFPSQTKPFEYVGYLDDDMVGYYAAIPFLYKVNGVKVEVGMVCDVMTSSKSRGKGVFTKMGLYSTNEMKIANIPFTIGHVIRENVLPGHKKAGWNVALYIPLYIKFLKLTSLLKSKKLNVLIPIANLFLLIYNRFVRLPEKKKYHSSLHSNIEEIYGYDELVSKWQNEHLISLCKDLKYAKWRYSAPDRKYKFIAVRDKSEMLIGFASYRKIIRESVPSFVILDMIILNSYRDVVGNIQRIIDKDAINEGVEAVLLESTKKMSKHNRLLFAGYLRSPFTFKFIVKNLTEQYPDSLLFDENNWDIHLVDSDDQ